MVTFLNILGFMAGAMVYGMVKEVIKSRKAQ